MKNKIGLYCDITKAIALRVLKNKTKGDCIFSIWKMLVQLDIRMLMSKACKG